jgi:hypothetical protein
MKPNLSVNIPFAGFYNPFWSGEIEQQERQEIEYNCAERQKEDGIPPELRLSEDEYSEILMRRSDYSAMYASAARKIADAWNNLASEELELPLGLEFEEMDSPREYNFTTDRIFMSIPRASVAKLMRMARRDKCVKLAAVIKERFTSYDGFLSSYSNRLGDWLKKPLSQWDHNELGTLLRACVPDLDEDLKLYYAVCDCDGLYQEWSNGVDWPAVENDIAELREEKRQAIEAENPDYAPPEPRCPLTLDLFDGR